MPKPKLPSRKTLVNQLDSVFALLIKNRDRKRLGKCPFHHLSAAPIEHCFHFITRSKHSVRWDTRNAVGSCAGCNFRYEHDQTFIDRVFNWYRDTHGQEAWDQLMRDANVIVKRSRTDLIELRDLLREEAGVGK
jgi:hypothetical protein